MVLSCFGIQGFGATDWVDSDFANGTWDPKFTTTPTADSYLTIGGLTGFANSTTADPSWGGLGFNQPGIPNGAGWFNSNPPNLQGKVDPVTLRTLIGQFVFTDSSQAGIASPLTVSYNQGLGTPTQFSTFGMFNVCIPAPSALPLAAAVFGLVGRRRRI